MFDDLWNEATRDYAAEDAARKHAMARMAASKVWPFIANASDERDLGMRLLLIEDPIAREASAHQVDVEAVNEVLRADWARLAKSGDDAAQDQDDSDSDDDSDDDDDDDDSDDDDKDDDDSDDDSDDSKDSDDDSDDDSDSDDDGDSKPPWLKDKTSAYDPKNDPASWQYDERAHPGAPTSGVPSDLFPEGGVPLHGDLTPEQQAWMDKRSSARQGAGFPDPVTASSKNDGETWEQYRQRTAEEEYRNTPTHAEPGVWPLSRHKGGGLWHSSCPDCGDVMTGWGPGGVASAHALHVNRVHNGVTAAKTAGTETTWTGSRPSCDICKYMEGKDGVPAQYDGKTQMGPWAAMCEKHFQSHGVGLGTGKGQKITGTTASKTAAGQPTHWVRYNEYGGIQETVPHADMVQAMSESPTSNGWRIEQDSPSTVSATGPEGTSRQYYAYPSGAEHTGAAKTSAQDDGSIYCPTCKGTGGHPWSPTQKCPKCKGTGVKKGPRKQVADAMGMPENEVTSMLLATNPIARSAAKGQKGHEWAPLNLGTTTIVTCKHCGVDKPERGEWVPSCDVVNDSFNDPKHGSKTAAEDQDDDTHHWEPWQYKQNDDETMDTPNGTMGKPDVSTYDEGMTDERLSNPQTYQQQISRASSFTREELRALARLTVAAPFGGATPTDEAMPGASAPYEGGTDPNQATTKPRQMPSGGGGGMPDGSAEGTFDPSSMGMDSPSAPGTEGPSKAVAAILRTNPHLSLVEARDLAAKVALIGTNPMDYGSTIPQRDGPLTEFAKDKINDLGDQAGKSMQNAVNGPGMPGMPKGPGGGGAAAGEAGEAAGAAAGAGEAGAAAGGLAEAAELLPLLAL